MKTLDVPRKASNMGLQLVEAKKGPGAETRTRVDTLLITPKALEQWLVPPFQRPVRINAKVTALAEHLKSEDGVLPGIITIGVLKGKLYIVDGQHRTEAFKLSGLEEGYTDVRYRYFDSLAEMGQEFVMLNSQLVRMRPDDILRGLEGMSEALKLVRLQLPFVGYDQIRRSMHSPIVSMSALLRSWFGSQKDIPGSSHLSAMETATSLTTEEAANMIEFMQLALKAFGRDPEYYRLWGGLNLTICMWLYRRIVVASYSPKVPRLPKELFGKCMATLSASPDYLDWLIGRQLTDRDRSPGYRRIKAAFVKRLEQEMNRKVMLPQPEWVSG